MLIKVRVFPGAKKGLVIKKSADALEVFVKASPREGAATRETIVALADYFGTPSSGIRLIKGARQRNKIFEIMLK
jgi:uncharacterized protein YggU (UPF0235/DUF167 family)